MAIVSRKISSFPNLPKLSGEEFIMVAYNGKSYKIPVKMLTGNAIQTISQRVNDGDGADNPITMVVGLGEDSVTYTFHLYNGQRGSEGPQGKTGEKGVKGDTGIAIYDYDDIDGLIYDSWTNGDSDALSTMILSAKLGIELNQKLDALKEEFLTQVEYDDLVARDEIDPNTKYFIWEE